MMDVGVRYETDLSSVDALEQAKSNALNAGGIAVKASTLPPLHTMVSVGVLLPGNVEMELKGRVVNHVTQSGAFFVLLDDGPEFEAFENAMAVALADTEEDFDWDSGFDEPEPSPSPSPSPSLSPSPSPSPIRAALRS